jgi:hypothetical protein
MKEFAVKNKKHSININRVTHLEKYPSAALVKPSLCQPKPQPNIIHFSQYAHPRCKDEQIRKE